MGILTFRGNWLQKLGFPQRAPFFTGSDCLDNPQRPYNIFFFYFTQLFWSFWTEAFVYYKLFSHRKKKCVLVYFNNLLICIYFNFIPCLFI